MDKKRRDFSGQEIPTKRWTAEELARMTDHTYVETGVMRKQMEKLCKEARGYHFATVAINSSQTALCAEYLRDGDIHVGAAISFSLGQTAIVARVFEAEDAIQNGMDEIGYIINLTEVKVGNWEYVKGKAQRIVTVYRNNGKLCRVILETCYLTKDEIKQVCKIAVIVRPDFAKALTGPGSAGVTTEDVALMRRCVGAAIKVKTFGGMRDVRTFKKVVSSGALHTRTSVGVSIVRELQTEAFKYSGHIAIPEEHQYPCDPMI